MKKIINITFIMVLLANIATSQPWDLGGNTPGASSFLGSTSGTGNPVNIKNEDNQPIRFFTNTGSGNLTPLRMIIAGGGNVGIGTLTAPNYLLHQDVSGNNDTYHQFTNGNTSTTSGDGFIIGLRYDGTATKSFAELNQQENARMNFLTQGTQRMTIDAGGTGALTGFVGIGNNFNSPKSRLHINQGSSEDCWLQMTTSTTGNSNTTDGLRIGVVNSSGNVEINQQENADMLFYTNASERMRLLSGGNVGIATSAPTAILGIGGNSARTIQMERNTASSAGNDLTVLAGGATFGVANLNGGSLILKSGISTGTGSSIIQLATAPSSSSSALDNSSTVKMTILGNGNTGVNTTSPDQKFEIIEGTGSPQARLTFTDNTLYTDLQTTYQGDLYISPWDGNNSVPRNVGICTNLPTSRLHVVSSNNLASSLDGAKIVFSNTTGSTTTGKGLNVSSTMTATGSENRGIHSSVDGGGVCSGFYADIDNSNASATSNYGFFTNMTDNGNSSGTTNTGFYNVNPANTSNATNNIGFESLIGSGSSFDTPGNMTGIKIRNYNSSATNIGVDVNCVKTNDDYSTGTWYGVRASSGYDFPATTGITNNYGGSFYAVGGTTINYGVYATGGTSCTTSPTTGNCPDAAGFFSGDVGVTNHLYQLSDAFLKDNIQPLANSTAILNQLLPKTYTYKTQDYPSVHLSEGNNFGLIAEDVEQVLPELVRHFAEPEVKDAQGNIVTPQIDFKALNYTALIPILIAGFQEQQAQIAALQAQIDNCCAAPRQGFNTPNSESIELEDMASLQLLQNDPNPFSESTMIKFNIPDDFKNAVINFYDSNGKQINTYKVNTIGANQLQVFGSNLSSGTYTYSLIVDGKLIASKKMVRTSK